MPISSAAEQQNRLQFVITEIELGCTFARIALTTTSRTTRLRNIENARKAYEGAIHFLHKTSLSEIDREQITSSLGKLEDVLVRLEHS